MPFESQISKFYIKLYLGYLILFHRHEAEVHITLYQRNSIGIQADPYHMNKQGRDMINQLCITDAYKE